MTRAEFTAKWQPVLTVVAGPLNEEDWAELMADFDRCHASTEPPLAKRLERQAEALEKSAAKLGHDAARRILMGHARSIRHLFEESPF